MHEWVHPDSVVEKPLSRDVAAALDRLGGQPASRISPASISSHWADTAGGASSPRTGILFDRGDASHRVYLLLSGEVQAELPVRGTSDERILRFQSGEILGTDPFLSGTEHSATVRALDDLYVLELTKDEVQDAFRQNRKLAPAFMHMVYARMRAASSGEQ